MSKNLSAIIGLLITLIYITGFAVLFSLNPQTYDELNNLCIAAYNMVDMDARLWAAIIIYLLVGILNIIFCISIFLNSSNRSLSVVGKILILISGVIWLSFGILPYDPMTDIGNHLLGIRVILIIAISFLGLLFLGAEFEVIFKDHFLKWYTIASGLLILVLSLLSMFVFNDETWVRTNLSLTIYFAWFGIFGLRVLHQSENKSPLSSV